MYRSLYSVVDGPAGSTGPADLGEKPSAYDVAVDLLVDLREVCDPVVFASRLVALRREHGRKVTFIQRLSNVGL